MTCSDEDRGRSRRHGAEERGWSHRSGTRWLRDREVEWCCVRSAPCTWRRGARVSWLSFKTKVDGLSVVWSQNHSDGFSSIWASKPMTTVCEWFGLKTTRTVYASLASKPVAMVSSGLASKPDATVSSGLASKPAVTVSGGLTSKPAVTVSRFGPQNWRLRFGDLCLKITVTVSWFGPQDKRVSICRLRHKTDGERLVRDMRRDLAACFVWKQVGLEFPNLPQN
jgi:hypothetical protein